MTNIIIIVITQKCSYLFNIRCSVINIVTTSVGFLYLKVPSLVNSREKRWILIVRHSKYVDDSFEVVQIIVYLTLG